MPLIGLPVCLWRLPIGFGCMMGMDVPPASGERWLTVPYVLALSLLSEAFALLCSGLVSWWGEVVPEWVPVAGGRRIPPVVAIVPAAFGGLLFSAVLVDWVLSAFRIGGFEGVAYTSTGWKVLADVVTGLCALWGPMTLALTYAYYRRRCRPAG
ncbi:hypothetical protein [Streptomyces cinnamoneus]|uniref:DUF3995 domain-containing protein n=1 Tax=Streptomyces cinnamoneus TaxID=53446 RepID=A0A918TKU8_STRCJ|nr:hypothetical protein [Streptomyces cinnamoneus]GHC50252.1 hypothetical protein GCM10010507_27590 [Streptomyces cinnamoneus]